jgi:multiple sugar transport system substrate-binding protein
MTIYDSPALDIVDEEVQAFFSGDKSAEAVAAIIQNRVEIYLGEQQ